MFLQVPWAYPGIIGASSMARSVSEGWMAVSRKEASMSEVTAEAQTKLVTANQEGG